MVFVEVTSHTSVTGVLQFIKCIFRRSCFRLCDSLASMLIFCRNKPCSGKTKIHFFFIKRVTWRTCILSTSLNSCISRNLILILCYILSPFRRH